MLVSRHHFHCEACEGTWVADIEIGDIADCPFCQARDIFAYRSDEGRGEKPDAGKIARRLAATLRKAVKRPAVAEGRRIKRAS